LIQDEIKKSELIFVTFKIIEKTHIEQIQKKKNKISVDKIKKNKLKKINIDFLNRLNSVLEVAIFFQIN
jgi:hypothetical protein